VIRVCLFARKKSLSLTLSHPIKNNVFVAHVTSFFFIHSTVTTHTFNPLPLSLSLSINNGGFPAARVHSGAVSLQFLSVRKCSVETIKPFHLRGDEPQWQLQSLTQFLRLLCLHCHLLVPFLQNPRAFFPAPSLHQAPPENNRRSHPTVPHLRFLRDEGAERGERGGGVRGVLGGVRRLRHREAAAAVPTCFPPALHRPMAALAPHVPHLSPEADIRWYWSQRHRCPVGTRKRRRRRGWRWWCCRVYWGGNSFSNGTSWRWNWSW